jgi:hypothetical protein
MKEIGVPGEAEITTLVVIDTDCIGSYKLPYNPDHDGPGVWKYYLDYTLRSILPHKEAHTNQM